MSEAKKEDCPGEMKVLVRGAAMRPYGCFAIDLGNRGMVSVWRQDRNVELPVPLVDVFVWSHGLYDDLIAAFDDDDQETLRMLWSKAEHVASAALIALEQSK